MAHLALAQLGATRRRNLAEEGPWAELEEKGGSIEHGSCGKHAPRERSAPQQGRWARDIPDTYPGCACARHAHSGQPFGALTCDKMGSVGEFW